MELFWTIWCSLAFVFLLPLAYHSRPKGSEEGRTPQGYRELQSSYLVAWSLCVLADWFQGPYLYALYSSYGYSHSDIGNLFMVGFATSGFCGMFVGAFADSCGRKQSALLYVIAYVISCLTQHVNSFRVLMFGRVLSGLATSLLYSVFESWLVYECRFRHGCSQQTLSYTFSLMYALNYIVAISAGVLAQILVENFQLRHLFGEIYCGSSIMAFDMAIFILMAAGVFIFLKWEENYGHQAQSIGKIFSSLADGARMVCRDPKLILCTAIVSLFESTMFIFTFSWTPLLVTKSSHPPLGIVFSTFMMACAGGASTFRIWIDRGAGASTLLFIAVFVATFAMTIPNVNGIGEHNVKVNFFALVLFEFAVGMYFPAMSLIKSHTVSEECRATLYNTFRMPMNAIVVGVLWWGLHLRSIFALLNAMLFCALCMVTLFMTIDKAGTGVGGMKFETSSNGERRLLRPGVQQNATA